MTHSEGERRSSKSRTHALARIIGELLEQALLAHLLDGVPPGVALGLSLLYWLLREKLLRACRFVLRRASSHRRP